MAHTLVKYIKKSIAYKQTKENEIKGHVDIFTSHIEEEDDGKI